VKELLESDSICQSYSQMKKGPVFLTHSVDWPSKNRMIINSKKTKEMILGSHKNNPPKNFVLVMLKLKAFVFLSCLVCTITFPMV